MTHSPNLNHKV